MSAAHIVVFPRGQLSAEDKATMHEFGICAVEADKPDQVVQVHLTTPLMLDSSVVSGDAIVTSLLRALAAQEPATIGGSITSSGRVAHQFVRLLAEAVTPVVTATGAQS